MPRRLPQLIHSALCLAIGVEISGYHVGVGIPQHVSQFGETVRVSGGKRAGFQCFEGGRKTDAALEVGDLLFAVVNLARHLDADPEAVLRATNLKFERRFAAIEEALAARGKSPGESSLAEMDALWDAAKAAEKSGSER